MYVCYISTLLKTNKTEHTTTNTPKHQKRESEKKKKKTTNPIKHRGTKERKKEMNTEHKLE